MTFRQVLRQEYIRLGANPKTIDEAFASADANVPNGRQSIDAELTLKPGCTLTQFRKAIRRTLLQFGAAPRHVLESQIRDFILQKAELDS